MSEKTLTPADERSLLLIDGHSLAYRAFFALPVENFSTATGQHTNAVYGFTSMLINVLGSEKPTHCVVSFDLSRETFRLAEYSEYKAGRSKTPDEFKGQVALVEEVLAAFNIPVVTKAGFEADDVLATLATQASQEGYSVLLMSGDRDCLQLVSDRTTVLYPRKGVSDMVRMTPAAVEEKYGVTPDNYPGLAALVGESADNLPGVPKVGPKTAARWIATYGGLDGVIANVDKIPGVAGNNLREHIDSVLRNQRLNLLVRDVDLDFGLDDAARTQPNREAVHQLFDALEFRVLRDRLFAETPDETETTSSLEAEPALLAPDDVMKWLSAATAGPVGVQALGHWAQGTGDVAKIAIASPDQSLAERIVVIDLNELDEVGDKALAAWLADESVPKVMHEAKGALQALAARGMSIGGLVDDTALAAYLLHPDQRSYQLDDLAVRHLGMSLPDAADSGEQLSLDLDGGSAEARAAGQRAEAVRLLHEALVPELVEKNSTKLLSELELPVMRVLAGMENAGVAVDLDRIGALEAEFSAAAQLAADAAYATIGKQINLGSPKQLQVVLFDELDMPKTKRTKTGYTTDAEALADLYVKTEHPFLQHLLEFRDSTRLKQTVEGLRKSIADDDRIHTTYQQTVAATGRLSSTDPNLQNIPVRTNAGRQIREVFVVGKGSADAGFECLLTADYSQIEMRIMAHLSGDAGLQEAFLAGEDLHRFVGARVFGVDESDVTSEMRSKVKAMSYGLVYGLSPFGLSRQLRISVEEARALMNEYFERFGGVQTYLATVVDEARRTGYTETIYGRRRYLPDLTSDNRQRREMAERAALNAPIQGSAADIMKRAMLGVDRALRDAGVKSRMLLQVHDEIIVEIASGERDVVEQIVRTEMAGAADLDVPLDVNVGYGRSWHEAAH
ncbi:DNA polymerase I [Saxibacter everestensis]|uniref:DNA polymerase I n=1 Tax=Saxibacter everestensis TaxID=2909229 RepID=A0ABY8QZW1_9MICO|nr:DNA polymerase I [Brevibacteriaceae bacterium ZFBP1038]